MRPGIRNLWRHLRAGRPAELDAALHELRARQPAPTLWLLGKTQSGKTSIIRYLTGADDAVIGNGFRPCTRTGRRFAFPSTEVALLNFLDTRGLDEPGYDPGEDIATFGMEAHLVVITVKITDFAQATLLTALRRIREARPDRPVLLVLTCLHEALSGALHPRPYPEAFADPLGRLIAEQTARFGGLVESVVAVDLTRPEEGFAEPNYGGEALKAKLLALLPEAFRESLATMDGAMALLKDVHQAAAAPWIAGYASLAATAAAVPVPFVDLLVLPGVQVRMIHHLAKIYGQPMSSARMVELGGALGLGLLTRQGLRELAKLVPYAGSALAATFAWASTYALGRAFCLYLEEVHRGHVPSSDRMRLFYEEHLALAKTIWQR